MIEDNWTKLKATLINERGYDGLVDFLSFAHAVALEERALAATRERMQPDYQALTPHDLQTRVANVMIGVREPTTR